MFLDIPHQEADHDYGYDKGNCHPHQQDCKLRRCKRESELQNLKKTCPQHNGNCEKKPLKEKVIILGKGNTVIKITTAIKP